MYLNGIYLIVVKFRSMRENGDAEDEHVVWHDVGQLLSGRLAAYGAVQRLDALAAFSDVLKNLKPLTPNQITSLN